MVYPKQYILLVMGLLCLGVWPCCGQGDAPISDKPNILYIFTDDQSHRSVSCYSEARPWAKTPHIDNLAINTVYHKTLVNLRLKAVEEFRKKEGDFVDHLP